MDEVQRLTNQSTLLLLGGLVGFVFGIAVEYIRHSNATKLELQKSRQAREVILYQEKINSYKELMAALRDFNEKAQDGRLINSEQFSRPAANEIESAWRCLKQTAQVGIYSKSVTRALNDYLELPCWEPLNTQNLSDPRAPRLADPLAFFNAVLNTVPDGYLDIVRDAINRDLEQLPPAQYVVI